MFDRSPKLSLCNATGISNEDVSELQNELRRMAADLVGEVRCNVQRLDCVTTSIIKSSVLREKLL